MSYLGCVLCVRGMWNRRTKELVLFRGATADTVAHELAGHAVRQWAETNAPELARKFDAYAKECPEELKREIERLYPDFNGEALMDELAANRLERELGERFRELIDGKPEAKTWWGRVKAEFKAAWRQVVETFGGGGIDAKGLAELEPPEAMKRLVDGMLEGRRLDTHGLRRAHRTERRANGTDGGVRPSIGRLYTGGAADYEKPSLHFVGTGEGSQVYGWGLYASDRRGVAEQYAKATKGSAKAEVLYKGRQVDEHSGSDLISMASLMKYAAEHPEYGDFEAYMGRHIAMLEGKGRLYRPMAEDERRLLEMYRADPGAWKVEKPKENVYEQTFFTDRAPGDESRLLKWYEPVGEGQRELILEGLKDLGGEKRRAAIEFVNRERERDLERDGLTWKDVEGEDAAPEHYPDDVLHDYLERYVDLSSTGGDVYGQLKDALGSPRAASEFLAGAGIDGVKYPVDSYGGKGVKDGGEAGWNYVSFRDDNIRVDHKWTDGEMRFSVVPRETALEDARKAIDEMRGKEFTNKATGISARLSSAAKGKLISNRAAGKSIANGFSRGEHNSIAAKVGELFEGGVHAASRGDRGGDANIRAIRRFAAPVTFDGGRDAVAWITVKDTKQHGNRIYSVEGIELEALSRKVEEELAFADHALSAPTQEIIPQPGTEQGTQEKELRPSIAGYRGAANLGMKDNSEADAMERREYDGVVARYTNPDGTRKAGWMKAPNGKPTSQKPFGLKSVWDKPSAAIVRRANVMASQKPFGLKSGWDTP